VNRQTLTKSPWQRHIQRADELAGRQSAMTEVLRFYARVAQFQEQLYLSLASATGKGQPTMPGEALSSVELSRLVAHFARFLGVIKEMGPDRLKQIARDLLARRREAWEELLNHGWEAPLPHDAVDPSDFLAQAFLQPYAAFMREKAAPRWRNPLHSLCPFCGRKPGLGVLRQQGDGASRSLMCSLCLAEWEFRRLVCPECGEENDRKLPVYTAEDFDHIRVEGCDTCKKYIKSVDLTKNGLADPLVDEIAAASLDLWAQEQGYRKLTLNMMGL
jgi:formate dehydrogenase maturation protein FdhE